MAHRPIEIGERNGYLVVQSRDRKAGNSWVFTLRCDCGRTISVVAGLIRRQKSCLSCSWERRRSPIGKWLMTAGVESEWDEV